MAGLEPRGMGVITLRPLVVGIIVGGLLAVAGVAATPAARACAGGVTRAGPPPTQKVGSRPRVGVQTPVVPRRSSPTVAMARRVGTCGGAAAPR